MIDYSVYLVTDDPSRYDGNWLDGLGQIATLTAAFPNCAIGGITLLNGAQVLASGAQGLAVVSAFSKSENPYEVAKNFSLLFDHRRK